LKLEELFPHDGIPDAGGGLDDAVFVQVTELLEEVVQRQEVDEGRLAMCRELPETLQQDTLRLGRRRKTVPQGGEPASEQPALFGALGNLNQAEVGARCNAQTFRREGAGARDDPSWA
jgi:hypothetical protein